MVPTSASAGARVPVLTRSASASAECRCECRCGALPQGQAGQGWRTPKVPEHLPLNRIIDALMVCSATPKDSTCAFPLARGPVA